MNQEIPISIIIPSYNQGKFIENAILSVRKQEYRNWELIIQDGNSQDETQHICERYGQMDDRIKFFREPDRGFADAVNKALFKCSGLLAGIQSSDDFYAHNRVFSEVANTWRDYPDLFLISGQSIAVDTDLRALPITSHKEEYGFISPEKIFTFESILPQESTFFSVKRAAEVGGLDPELDMSAETDFYIKMAVWKPVSINKIYRIPQILGAVVYHDKQRSYNHTKFYIGNIKMLIKLWKNKAADLHPDFKYSIACRSLDIALRHFNAVGDDIRPLVDLYKELHGNPLPFKQKLKAILCRFATFRKFYYKNQTINSSQYYLDKFPTGYSIRWF